MSLVVICFACHKSKLSDNTNHNLDSADFKIVTVKVNDSFWSSGLECWEAVTVNDVFDKFEGKYTLEEKPVKAINICTHTSKIKWLEMIDTHKLKTVNLYANKAWENKLEQNYLVSAYPRYVLIGRDGRVIQNFAKRPREVSKEIEGALDH